MKIDLALRQTRSRRGTILKLIRQGHEEQLSKYYDGALAGVLLDMAIPMGIFQLLTMLQDLCVLGYIAYDRAWDVDLGRYRLENIILTPVGLRFVDRKQSNEDVAFD